MVYSYSGCILYNIVKWCIIYECAWVICQIAQDGGILGGRLDNRPPLYQVMRFTKQFVYTMFINNNPALFHLWWKENLVKYLKHFLKHAGFKWLKSSHSFSVFTLFEVYITCKFILHIVRTNHSCIIYFANLFCL